MSRDVLGRTAERLCDRATRRPVLTLLAAAACVALSVAALARSQIDVSLGSMIGGANPPAAALTKIIEHFHAVDELLVLVSLPEGATPAPAQQARLIAYAERLAAAIAASSDVRSMTIDVRFRPDPALQRFIEDHIVPAGLLYLDDASFAAFVERLTPEEVRAQLARSEAMLAAPGPGAVGKSVLRDPLRLREFVQRHFGALAAGASEANFSDDGRSLLIRIAGARPVDDTDFSKRFVAEVGAIADAVNTDDLGLQIGGGYAVAATAATTIRSDAISSTIVSVALIQLLFLGIYRRLFLPILILGAPAIGIVAAFGLHALFAPALSPLTAAGAAMLAGLGVDYAIHFNANYHTHREDGLPPPLACRRSARETARPLVTALLTSIFAFAAIAFSDVHMLRDFAVLGALGLAGALLGVLTILPTMLCLTDRHTRVSRARLRLPHLADAIAARRRLYLMLGLLILASAVAANAATPGFAPTFEPDLTVMHPRPNPALDAQERIDRAYSSSGDVMLVHMSAPSPAALLALAHDVAAALRTPDAATAGVRGSWSIADLLPDPKLLANRIARLEALEVDVILAGVENALADSSFDPIAFSAYLDFIRQLLNATAAPTLDDLAGHEALARQVLPIPPAPDRANAGPQAVSVVRIAGGDADRAFRENVILTIRSALADYPDAILTGMGVLAHDLERATRESLPRLMAVSVVLVALVLTTVFRRVSDVVLAMTPAAYGMLCIFGAMSAFGVRLNVVNMLALPLLAGIAVDNGIFLVAAARRSRGDATNGTPALRPPVQALLCTAGTTVLGFGALAWSHTPAVSSLGVVSAIGVAAALAGSLLVLLPVLTHLSSQRRPE